MLILPTYEALRSRFKSTKLAKGLLDNMRSANVASNQERICLRAETGANIKNCRYHLLSIYFNVWLLVQHFLKHVTIHVLHGTVQSFLKIGYVSLIETKAAL